MSFGVPRKAGRVTLPLLVFLVLVILVAGVVAAIILTQTVPPTSPAVISGCPTLTLSVPVTAPTTSGTEVLTCGTGPAINSVGGSATPSFTLPTGYASLGIVTHGAVCSGSSPLISGTAIVIASGGWDYCANYASVPSAGLAGFTVNWS